MTEVLIPPQGPNDGVNVITAEFLGVEGTEHLSYTGLFDRYAASSFGLFHADQPVRYSNRYAYDTETMLADLGDNIHPIRHMQYTEAAIFRPLVAAQNQSDLPSTEKLSDFDIAAGRLAALLHDIGECEHPDIAAACGNTIGDVNYWDKTADHDKQEVGIRAFLYSRLYTDLPTELLTRTEDIIANPEESFPGQIFKVAEHIGYFLTDLAAGLIALEIKDHLANEADELRFAQLSRMALGETAGWHQKLTEHGQRFPYAATVAEESAPDVESILADLS